jgi:pimeloyl-ACP methyl ester carboxylesterase
MTRSLAKAISATIEAAATSVVRRSASKALIDELAVHIRAAETIEVEGVGHDIHNARPQWFVQTVLDWLTKH